MNKKSARTIGLYILVAVMLISTVMFFSRNTPRNGEEVSYTNFLRQVKSNNVSAVVYSRQDAQLYGLKSVSNFVEKDLPSKYDFYVNVEENTLRKDLSAIASVSTDMEFDHIDSSLYNIESFRYNKISTFSIISLIPSIMLLLLLGASFFLMMRQQGGGNAMNSFARSKARIVSGEENKITFADVAGADEEKAELAEIVEFLKTPKRFTEMGARIPKGVLLMGPPGTGKTLLAKAIAGEASSSFYSISGSDFVEMYVGVGASRVRDLFTTAKKTAPAIIFIDEIDAVGRQRGAGLGGGHDEREQTLNQLLVEMDGFDPYAGIIVVAATNRSDILDPALLRPGRFDRQIIVNRPDVKGREAILKVHSKGKPLSEDVDLNVLARRTPGFTGADLENVLNESAILAVRHNRDKITMPDVEEAITRVLAGPEKRSRVISDEDKKITAYHEVGHAVVGRVLPGCDPVHEITIIQRGMAAGMTMTLPEEERQFLSKNQILDQLCMLLGGRAAEQEYIGEISTGASNDIQRATEFASRMVREYGMSDEIGTIYLGNGDQEVFLGRDIGSNRHYSEKIAAKVDMEISRIIHEAYTRTEVIIKEQKASMDLVATTLIENEQLSGFQFENLCLLAEGKSRKSIEEILQEKKPVDYGAVPNYDNSKDIIDTTETI